MRSSCVLFLILIAQINLFAKVFGGIEQVSGGNTIISQGVNLTTSVKSISSLSVQEFTELCGTNGVNTSNLPRFRDSDLYINNFVQIPTSINWRAWMTPVEQQHRGTCWAHAATGVAEAMIFIYRGGKFNLNLNENYMAQNNMGGTFNGGWLGAGESDIMNERVPSINIWTWDFWSVNNGYHANGIDEIKEALVFGPVSASMDVYADFMYYDPTTIYETPINGTYLNGHAVVIVGYDSEIIDGEEVEYWICKNSWGTGWGDGGYFKIKFGECNIDDVAIVLEVNSIDSYAKIIPDFIPDLPTALSYNFSPRDDEGILIQEDITIQNSTSLLIPAGTKIAFVDYCGLTINGKIEAIGNSSNPIIFSQWDEGGVWSGLRLINANSSSILDYCEIKNATTGILVQNSSPTIKNSHIHSNGNGIYLSSSSNPLILNSVCP